MLRFASIVRKVSFIVCEHCLKVNILRLRALLDMNLEHIFSDIDKFYFMIGCF
jgi:hypothetical protein